MIEDKDPHAPDSNFGSIVTAIGYDDLAQFVTRVVPGASAVDPKVIGELLAAGLAVGGYIGAELTTEGVAPPPEERSEFRFKWPRVFQKTERVLTAAAAELGAVEPTIVKPS